MSQIPVSKKLSMTSKATTASLHFPPREELRVSRKHTNPKGNDMKGLKGFTFYYLPSNFLEHLWHIVSWSLYQPALVWWTVTSGGTCWNFHQFIYFCIFVGKVQFPVILTNMLSTSSSALNEFLTLAFPLLNQAHHSSTASVLLVTSFPRISIKSFSLPKKCFGECFPYYSFKGRKSHKPLG